MIRPFLLLTSTPPTPVIPAKAGIHNHRVLLLHSGPTPAGAKQHRSVGMGPGSRFTPPKLLEEMAAKDETFYGRFPPKKQPAAA